MGYVRAQLRISNPQQPGRVEEVELLADSGAIYIVLPTPLLERLGIQREGKERFQVADGRIIERDYGVIRVQIGERRGATRVVFGREGDASVLGVTALEELGLKINPTSGQLEPLELLLL